MDILQALINLILGFFQAILNIAKAFIDAIFGFLQGVLNLVVGIFT